MSGRVSALPMAMANALMALWLLGAAIAWAAAAQAAERVVGVGGALTEIVYALGAESTLVGVDTTSTWPAAARTLPSVGYPRALSAEGILSLAPTQVLATDEAGPPIVFEQLRAAGVRVLRLPTPNTVDGVEAKVRGVAAALGTAPKAEALIAQLRADYQAARALVAAATGRPRVLFVIGAAGGNTVVAGRDTAADAMISLAGGVNAVSEFTGFKPLTAEAALSARPDALLVFEHGVHGLDKRESVLTLPGIALTPAAKQGRLIAMDALYLLGFGPRLGQAIKDLALALHPDLERRR